MPSKENRHQKNKDPYHLSVIIPFITTICFIVVAALPEYVAWNWLMPAVFGAETVSYWQSLGVTFVATFVVKLAYRSFRKKTVKSLPSHYEAKR